MGRSRNFYYGEGINSGERPTSFNGALTREFKIWQGILQRCYSEACQIKHPSYKGCLVSDNFKNYSYFYDWCSLQTGFEFPDFAMNKDILGTGKLYSEEFCCFVPREINNLFILRDADRGIYPLGVTKIKNCNTFIARLNVGKDREYLGAFSTPEEAYKIYVDAKEDRIKQLAEKYKSVIDVRVYNSLVNYRVEVSNV